EAEAAVRLAVTAQADLEEAEVGGGAARPDSRQVPARRADSAQAMVEMARAAAKSARPVGAEAEAGGWAARCSTMAERCPSPTAHSARTPRTAELAVE